MNLDLSFLRSTPEFSSRALLSVDALAPLSLVAKMPGKYYRSQPEPTDGMLLAMLENALGWHISVKERDALLKFLAKRHKRAAERSGVGFGSVLQWHVRIANRHIPDAMHFDDLWAQHLHSKGTNFVGGSRNYDKAAIPLMNAAADKTRKITFSDGGEGKTNRDSRLLQEPENNTVVHVNLVRPLFPQYFVSPTPREYIVPDGVYKYKIETSPALAALLGEAIVKPAAPLYLGASEGWVEANWEVI